MVTGCSSLYPNTASFTFESKTYTPKYIIIDLVNKSDGQSLLFGWLPVFGSHEYTINIVFKSKSIPETGIYRLADLSETGQVSLFIRTPKPNHTSYRAISGELKLTNDKGTFTASFADVHIVSDAGDITSLASGRFTVNFNLQVLDFYKVN